MTSPAEPVNLDDTELARRITASGPGEAVDEEAELYRRFAQRVRFFGLRRLQDEQAAADLVQHVLLVTFEKLRAGEVRDLERVGSFILGVAHTLVMAAHRKARREEQLPEFFDLPVNDLHTVDPLAAERLRGCLEALPERERSVVVLTYYGEQSSGEIAVALGVAAGNVRIIRYRAIGRLRDCIGWKES